MPANNPQPPTPNRTPSRRLKVLISAYACEPGKGSEPGVGWNLSKEMADHHDVWVLTRSNNRKVIEAELETHPVDGLHFIFYDLPMWACWWKKGGRGVQLYYYLWQLCSAKTIRIANKSVGFDLGHHLTFGKCNSPSGLALASIPYYLGPIGGGDVCPWGLISSMGLLGGSIEIIRKLYLWISQFDPMVLKTIRRCNLASGSTPATEQFLNRCGCSNTAQYLQMGISEDRLLRHPKTIPATGENKKLSLLSIGRLVHWKGFHLAIQAIAKSGIECEYVILGEGPERARLERMVKKLGLQNKIKLLGQVSFHQINDYVVASDLLLHPAIHDQAPTCVLEALATGTPVVAVASGGVPFQVGDAGIIVPLVSNKSLVSALGNAIVQLDQDRELLRELGGNALKQVEHYVWSRKADRIADFYMKVLED